jgi:hypothetical protein
MADGITRIAVEGFKSIAKRQEIEIAPLTILAGANSSGKSSIMQPLLMLKQTLEATYDPGPLMINGPNLTFTRTKELLSNVNGKSTDRLRIEIATETLGFDVTFLKKQSPGFELVEETYRFLDSSLTLRPDMTAEELRRALSKFEPVKQIAHLVTGVIPKRFFLDLKRDDWSRPLSLGYGSEYVGDIIHVPGLRGSRRRTYSETGTGPHFPGTFDNYVGSIILAWQKESTNGPEVLVDDLQRTGMARNVLARQSTDVEIEVYVALDDLPRRVDNIADVGFGVSQVLPVLVALRVAEPGRLVYLEEPEIHLHPSAQTKLADVLAGAAKRGVRVVAETHSSLLLRAIQTLVAKGDLDPDLVRLHWFKRDAEGVSQVNSAKPDANGAFGDWPEDFGDVALESEQRYLDAVEDRLAH